MGDLFELRSSVRRLRGDFESMPEPVKAALFSTTLVEVGVHLARNPVTDGVLDDLFDAEDVVSGVRGMTLPRGPAPVPPPVNVVIVDELAVLMGRLNLEIEERCGAAVVRQSDSSFRCPAAKGARIIMKYYPPPGQVGPADGVLVEPWIRFSDMRSGPLDEHRLSECFGKIGRANLSISSRGGWAMSGPNSKRYVDFAELVPGMEVLADLVAYFGTVGSIAEYLRCRTLLWSMIRDIGDRSASLGRSTGQ
jgi:hypothetical protein